MRATLVTILLLTSACASDETTAPPPPDLDSALTIVPRLAGLWSGPATQTPLGDIVYDL